MDEKLIVEIAGDASKYAKMLDEAKAKTETSGAAISSAVDKSTTKTAESFEKAIEIAVKYAQKIRELEAELDRLKDKKLRVAEESDKLGDKILSIGKKMENLGTQTRQAGKALSELTAGISFQETFEAFNKQEKAERLLDSALRSNKQNVKVLSEEYRRYAKELQSVTTYGDQLSLELIQQATSFGLNEQQVKRAVQGAIGLAEATGRSTREVIKATVKLEAGSTEMLQEYMPTLLKITDKTEKVAKAHELLGQMFDVARESAKTSAGQLKQLENAWTDFKETIGKVIAERLGPVISLLKEISEAFQSLPTWVKESVATFLVLITVAGTLLTGIGALIVAFGTFGVVLEAIIGKTALVTAGMWSLKGVLIVGVAYAAYQAGKALTNIDDAMMSLNEATEKSKELNDKWANKFLDDTNKILKSVSDLDDRMSKSQFLTKAFISAQQDVQSYEKRVEAAKKEVGELNTRINRWRDDARLSSAISALDDYKRKLEMAKSRVDLIRDSLRQVNDVELDTALTGDIKKFKDELKLQVATLGMTSDEVKIYDLQMRMANETTLDFIRSQVKLNNALKENNEMYESMKGRIKDLEREIIIKFNSNNLTQGQKEVKRLNLLLDETRKKDELATNPYSAAVRAGQVQALINKYERLNAIQDKIEKRNELLKRGMEVMRHLDPVEEYRVSVDELTDLLEAGAINWTLYNKGVAEADKKFQDAVLSSVKLKESLGNLNAAKFGSAEAQDRIDKMNESLRNQMEQYKALSREREKLNKLSFDKIPKEFKENPFIKNMGKDIGAGLGSGITDFFKKTDSITSKLFPESPLVFPENPLGLKNNAPLDRSDLNGLVIENVKGMIKDLYDKVLPNPLMKEIEKLQQKNLTGPELENKLLPNPTAKNDNDAANDRKQSNKFLQNIDKTLVAINNKPTNTLGIVDIEE